MFCGRLGVVDVNHCFFECPATAIHTKDWRAAVENSRASLSELMKMPSGIMVAPSFLFLGNVWSVFSYGPEFTDVQPYRAPVLQQHYEDEDDEDYDTQCWGTDKAVKPEVEGDLSKDSQETPPWRRRQ